MSKSMRVAVLLALCGRALIGSETPTPEPESLFERLRAGDAEAVAWYERRFEEAQEAEDKSRIAMVLAEAGRASEVHVRYLETRAWQAVKSPRPFPFVYRELLAQSDTPAYTEEFEAWVETVSGDLEQEAHRAIFEQPAKVIPLTSVEGPRIDEILLAGLRSRNLMVRITSLKTLVNHGHADALPAMLEAIREMPAELHQGLGLELLRLLDERADEAARELIGGDRIYEETRTFFRPRAEPPP